MRTFQVILTKTFEKVILAESEEALRAALQTNQREIDPTWNPPGWGWMISEPWTGPCIPAVSPKCDMVVLDGEIYDAETKDEVGLKIAEAKQAARKTMEEISLEKSEQFFIQRVEYLLTTHFPNSTHSCHQEGDRFVVSISDPSFKKLTPSQQQDAVWKVFDRTLVAEDRVRISFVFCPQTVDACAK